MNFSTVPPHASIAAEAAEYQAWSTARSRSGSSRSPSAVEPVTSAKSTVTSLRASSVVSAGLAVPDGRRAGRAEPAPDGRTAPQVAQVSVHRAPSLLRAKPRDPVAAV